MSLKLANLFYFIHRIGLISTLKMLLSRIFRCPEIILNWNNQKFYIRNNRSDLAIFKQVFLDKVYLFQGLKCDTGSGVVIDLGANVGFFTKYYIAQYPHLKYFLLEPDRENEGQIKKNLSEYSNFKIIFGGIGQTNEFLKVEDPTQVSCSKKYLSVSSDLGNIPAYSLKDFLKMNEINDIFILKIDIEGAEQFLINDLEDILPSLKYLMIELHDSLIPGIASRFFKLVSAHSFNFEVRGDVLLFKLTHENTHYH